MKIHENSEKPEDSKKSRKFMEIQKIVKNSIIHENS